MITFTNMVVIDRPIREVYDYLADLEHIPEWNWAVVETTKTTPGPARVGTTYRQTRSVPEPAVETLTLSALEDASRIEVEGTLARLPAHLTYRLEETGGGTQVTNTVELATPGALRLVGPLVEDRVKSAVAENLRALKTLLDGT